MPLREIIRLSQPLRDARPLFELPFHCPAGRAGRVRTRPAGWRKALSEQLFRQRVS